MLNVKAILLTPFPLALYITCHIVLFPSAISFASNHWTRLFQLHCTALLEKGEEWRGGIEARLFGRDVLRILLVVVLVTCAEKAV